MESTTNSGWSGEAKDSVAGAAASAHGAIDRATDTALAAADSAKPFLKRVSGSAHAGVDKATEAAGQAADWVGRQGRNLREQQKRAVDATSDYVSENPLRSVAMTLAAGIVIGLGAGIILGSNRRE